MAIKWCSLARNSLFDSSGQANHCKIIRRIAYCHIELGDFFAARELLSELSSSEKFNALNYYLTFRIDIRYSSDSAIVANIEELVKCNDFQLPMLYHCAIEAQTLKNDRISLSLLEIILNQIKQTGVHDTLRMPALLRCIIKLLWAEIESDENSETRRLHVLCTHLENAAGLVRNPDLTSQNGFNFRELEWFSRNAHNIAVAGLNKWAPEYILRVIECIRIVRRPCSRL